MIRSAVVTSTIGRPQLRQCIESVRSQDSPARHYVYVNGRRFWGQAREILMHYPDVTAFYLPEETGDYGLGPSMADVFAAAPFLTRADWVFYLDDDNFYDPNHISSLLSLAEANALGWAYSLRRWVAIDGTPICDDDWCSLGHESLKWLGPPLVDNSCFAVSRRLAQRMSLAWTAAAFVGDRCFFMSLREAGVRSGCTGLSTVNYRIGTGSAPNEPGKYTEMWEKTRRDYPDGFPWRKPAVF